MGADADALEALRLKSNKKQHNAGHITPDAVASLKRQGFIDAANKLTDEGRLHLAAQKFSNAPKPTGAPKPKWKRAARNKDSLISIVKRKGGINSNSVKAGYDYQADIVEGGLLHAIRKQGMGLDEMAQSLQVEGHIIVPEGMDPGEHLLNEMKARHHSALRNTDKEIESEAEAYYKAKQLVEEEGHNERDIESIRRSSVQAGESAGQKEGATELDEWDNSGAEETGSGEKDATVSGDGYDSADASDYDRNAGQDAPVDTSFNFGVNADEPKADEPTPAPAAAPELARTKPSKAVVFNQPITGPSGAKLGAYQWQHKVIDDEDKNDGEKAKRVSDWEKAISSVDTNKDIVHHFTVTMPDGTAKTVSLESAVKLLGYEPNSDGAEQVKGMANTAKSLAKAQMQLSLAQHAESANEKIKSEVAKMSPPPIKIEKGSFLGRPNPKHDSYLMGDSRIALPAGDNTPPETIATELAHTWRRDQVTEKGGDNHDTHKTMAKDLQGKISKLEKSLSAKELPTPDEAPAATAPTAATAPPPPDDAVARHMIRQAFTGVDSLGRQWQDGELVAAKDEPAAPASNATPEPAPEKTEKEKAQDTISQWEKENPEPKKPIPFGQNEPNRKEKNVEQFAKYNQELEKWKSEKFNAKEKSGLFEIEKNEKALKNKTIRNTAAQHLNFAAQNDPTGLASQELKNLEAKSNDNNYYASESLDDYYPYWLPGATNYVEKQIIAAGGKKIHSSNSGSQYYSMPNGKEIRLSDHDIPDNEERSDRNTTGSGPKWQDNQIILKDFKTQQNIDSELNDIFNPDPVTEPSTPAAAEEPTETPTETPAEAPKSLSAKAPGVSLSDVPYDLALNAHRGTSFVPEKRAKQRQEDYVNQMQADWEHLSKFAKTPQQQEVLKAEFEKYKTAYLAKYKAGLSADSRILSPMISGPAKFPTRRNEKANAASRKRHEESIEFRKRALIAAAKAINPVTSGGPVLSRDADAVQTLQAQVEKLEKEHEQMKNINVAYSRFLKNPASLATSGLSEKSQALLKKFHETPPGQGDSKNPFPNYMINNSSANIRRIHDRIETLRKLKAMPEKEEKYSGGVTISHDPDDARIRIKFPGKPSPEVIKQIKSKGFIWSPTNGAWQRQLNGNGTYAADELMKTLGHEKITTEATMPTNEKTQKIKLVQAIIARKGIKPPQPKAQAKKIPEASGDADPRVKRIRELMDAYC
jgi:hypothetical protein